MDPNAYRMLKKDCKIINYRKVGDGEGYIGVVEKQSLQNFFKMSGFKFR